MDGAVLHRGSQSQGNAMVSERRSAAGSARIRAERRTDAFNGDLMRPSCKQLVKLLVLLLGSTGPVFGQSAAQQSPQVIPLWEQGAPGALGETPADKPTITAYLPPVPGSRGAVTAVIIAPGGAYQGLATSY